MLRRIAVIAALAAAVPAQVTPVPGTGCGNPITSVQGAPLVGGQITIVNPFLCLFQYAVVAVGTAATAPWINCSAQLCLIGLQPTNMVVNVGYANFYIPIPNQPALAGFCFRAQSACFAPPCLTPDQAVQICVQ